MKLYIPEIGDEIILSEPWTFSLYSEHRNDGIGIVLGYVNEGRERFARWKCNDGRSGYHCYDVIEAAQITFPKGTKLKVDRIYIRKGNSEYSSLSFRISYHENKDLLKKRFWAKLEDVNSMNIDDKA